MQIEKHDRALVILAVIAIAISLVQLCTARGDEAFMAARVMTVHGMTPTGAPKENLLLVGHLYTLSLDPETKVATWCSYRARAADAASRNAPARNWINTLPDVTLESSDYRGPEYDIGHLVPLATFKASAYAFELNFMGNCAPQRPNLNRGPWLKVETRIRELTAEFEFVDVVVGPLFETDQPKLPAADESHRVPSAFFAVIKPKKPTKNRGPPTCYIVPQSVERLDAIDQFAVSIDEVQRRSGLQFPK